MVASKVFLLALFAAVSLVHATKDTHLRERRTQAESAGGYVTGLRFVNTDSDEPWTAVASDPIFFWDEPLFVSLPYFAWNDYDVPTTHGLTIEALTNGTVGSVQFLYSQFNSGSTDPVSHVENTAPWAMCGNVGRDFFPCARGTVGNGVLEVRAYTGKSATGNFTSIQRIFILYRTTPEFRFYYEEAMGPVWLSANESDPTQISLASTPSLDLGLKHSLFGKRGWFPLYAIFDYDNGTIVRNVTYERRGDGSPPKETINMGPIVTTLGRHTLTVSVYRLSGVVGATPSIMFDVV